MLNVLLIDDSMVVRKMLRRVLGECGLGITEIFEAGDGSQALKLMEASQVHLILCDVNMPVMGGLKFLEPVQKRADWSAIPVIMMTTEGGRENVVRGVAQQAIYQISDSFLLPVESGWSSERGNIRSEIHFANRWKGVFRLECTRYLPPHSPPLCCLWISRVYRNLI